MSGFSPTGDEFRRLRAEDARRKPSDGILPTAVESQQAWLYASDEVLEDINVYLKAFSAYAAKKQHGADSADAWAAVKDAEGRLRLSIRKDLRPKTQITPQWVAGEWETIISRPERIRSYLGRDSGVSKEDETV